MLGHRLRHWPKIKPAIGESLLLSGKLVSDTT